MKEKLYELLGAIYGGEKNAIEDVVKIFNQLYDSINNARELIEKFMAYNERPCCNFGDLNLIDNILEEGMEMTDEN